MNTNAYLDNVKVNVLAEKIREAVKDGTLERNLSVFRMEGVSLGLTEDDLNELVSEAKRIVRENKQTKDFMAKHKTKFYVVLAVLIILEWLLPMGIGWKIILSILTIIVEIVVVAVLYVKHKKRQVLNVINKINKIRGK